MGHQHQSDHRLNSPRSRFPRRARMSFDRVARRRGEITVTHIGSKSRPTQPFRHFDCRGDRAVAPSCASERDGHVTFARGPVAGNPVDEKRFDAVHRLAPGRLAARDSRGPAGPRRSAAEARRPNAGWEGSEGRRPGRQSAKCRAQRRRRRWSAPAGRNRRRSAGCSSSRSSAGLRSVVSRTLSAPLRSGNGQPPFAGDAVLGRPVGCERVAPARLVIAAHQLGPGAVEVEDFGLDAVRSSGSDRAGASRIEAAAADVHADRGRGGPAFARRRGRSRRAGRRADCRRRPSPCPRAHRGRSTCPRRTCR